MKMKNFGMVKDVDGNFIPSILYDTQSEINEMDDEEFAKIFFSDDDDEEDEE